jgi:hypothetical protein
MAILQHLIKRKGFDDTCAVHEGFRIFQDVAEDFPYIYWGDRLAILHELVLDRPPRNYFQPWIRSKTSESNAFLVAMLALAITIIVGILTFGLAEFRTYIASSNDSTRCDKTLTLVLVLVCLLRGQERATSNHFIFP